SERAGHFERHLSEVSLSSGLRVLEHDNAIAGIAVRVHAVLDSAGCVCRNYLRHRRERTTESRRISSLGRSGSGTLWIRDRYIRIVFAEEASPIPSAVPIKVRVADVEVPNNVDANVGGSGR